MSAPPDEALARLQAICARFPEVTERPSHSAPTWFIRGRSSFVSYWAAGHHQNDFPHLWCAAPPGAQAEMVSTEPERFFRPPYVGPRGWVGVRLDVDLDWDEIAGICADAYRAVAPKKLVAALDEAGGSPELPRR